MSFYSEKNEEFKQKSSFRTIKNITEKVSKYVVSNGKQLLNLSSNDYLNMSTDKNLISEFTNKYKNSSEFLFSAASARLLTGTGEIYFSLENNLARMFNKDSALIFNTGYQCNQGIVSSLFTKSDVIFSDKLNHASIVSGLCLSPAKHFRYKHLDYDNLEKLLKEKRDKYSRAMIISESVFSMDGDIADIKKLIELKNKYDCMLMIDEAHAFGVFGENLTGVASQEGVLNDIDIITVTFGKAVASQGAACISSRDIIDFLINKASSFIFSTAIPPVNVLWTNFLLTEKLNLVKTKKDKLTKLFKFAHELYPTGSESQIIPVIIGSAEQTKSVADLLQNKGYYVLPVNPPTVPQGTSRLRLSLTSEITEEEIKQLFDIINSSIVRKEL